MPRMRQNEVSRSTFYRDRRKILDRDKKKRIELLRENAKNSKKNLVKQDENCNVTQFSSCEKSIFVSLEDDLLVLVAKKIIKLKSKCNLDTGFMNKMIKLVNKLSIMKFEKKLFPDTFEDVLKIVNLDEFKNFSAIKSTIEIKK